MGSDQRAIVGLLGAAVVFALVGETVKAKKGENKPGAYTKTILGGTLGAGLLLLLSEAGAPAADFAKGLALVTLVASILLNGQSVFTGIDDLTKGVASIPTTTKGSS
jgi:hypothetical protein